MDILTFFNNTKSRNQDLQLLTFGTKKFFIKLISLELQGALSKNKFRYWLAKSTPMNFFIIER